MDSSQKHSMVIYQLLSAHDDHLPKFNLCLGVNFGLSGCSEVQAALSKLIQIEGPMLGQVKVVSA